MCAGLGLGQMDELGAARRDEFTGFSHRTEMVLFEQGGGFLQAVLESLGRFQFGIAVPPLVLPVQGEGAEGDHRQTEPGQRPAADAVQAGQPGGLALDPAGGEGSLDQAQGSGFLPGPRGLAGGTGDGGDQGCR